MGRWRIGAILAAAAFVVSGATTQPAGTAPPHEPCPRPDVERPAGVPPPPEAPPHAPGDRRVGGAGLDTDGLTVPNGAPAPPDSISATSWLVADLDSGEVLGACAPHEHGPPASTIKLLLALTLLDELDPDDTVEITREDLDIEPGSSAVGLVAGGEYSVETLWLGLLLNSGNEVANTLARIGGGEAGVDGTLAQMNVVARRLEARQTRAVTPSGLDGPGQFTSAYDLALIARELFARDDFTRYTATERADIPAQPDQDADSFQIQNNNRLLFNYDGALGGKTGFTDLARQTYVGAAERAGRRLVVTLLGAERQPASSWQQGATLLDWGFSLPDGAAVGQLVEPQEPDLAMPATPPPVPRATLAPESGTVPRTDESLPVGVLVGAVVAGAGAVVLGVVAVAGVRARRRR